MEIKRGLLKKVNNDKLETEELYSESTFRHIGILYEEAVQRHCKRKVWFISPQLGEDKKEKRFEQIRKFVDLCLEIGLPFDVAMDNQVRVLVKFIREKGMSMKYPPFAMLVSENAKKRLGWIRDGIARRYTGQARTKEFFQPQTLDLEKSLRESIQKIYDRFRTIKATVGRLEKPVAVFELERLARSRMVTKVYIYSSPLNTESEFLTTILKEAEGKLSGKQKDSIIEIKTKLVDEYQDEEVLKYV